MLLKLNSESHGWKDREANGANSSSEQYSSPLPSGSPTLSLEVTMVPWGPAHFLHVQPGAPSHAASWRDGHPPVSTFPGWASPPTRTHLQCMMDEWCSPYSSCSSTRNGCSGRTPPPSGPAETRVSASSASTWSSGQGSTSGPLASAFFSAHCAKQSGDESAVAGLHWARTLATSGDTLQNT